MQVIPLQPKKSQSIQVILGEQPCTITVSQKSGVVYLTLLISGNSIISNVICRDRVRIVRLAYMGFAGDLVFVDQQGTSDPDYSGIGSRFVLFWLDLGDL